MPPKKQIAGQRMPSASLVRFSRKHLEDGAALFLRFALCRLALSALGSGDLRLVDFDLFDASDGSLPARLGVKNWIPL